MKRTDEKMAALIAEALAEDGLTQAEFARRVGVSEKHMSQVLTGKTVGRNAALDYWAFALGRRFVVRLESTSDV